MIGLVMALALQAMDDMDRYIIDACVRGGAATSAIEKYAAVEQGLMAIDGMKYSAKRADLIGLMYGSLLLQEMPRTTKLGICCRLRKMNGMDFSLDSLLKIAAIFREEVIMRPIDNNSYSFELGRPKKDLEIVDELVVALESRKKVVHGSFSTRRNQFPGKPREIR